MDSMKKIYETPMVEIVEFETEDIITSSNDPTNPDSGNGTPFEPLQ